MSNDRLLDYLIDDRYRLDAVIGKGGMGTVYRATRLLIGDEVAIKVLSSRQLEDPQAAERFRREARAAARLKHPNAVSIYDFGVSSKGLQFLVMDLVEGRSLREIIKEEGRLDPRLVSEITAQVCAALDEAHRQNIVHRDIKPDNIILNSTSAGLRVKVLDFGIAKLRDDSASKLTHTGNVMGTPHYMSPEQCLGEELDSRADIYSLGIVVYEMLCGRVPFNAPVSTGVIVQHVNQTPPSLRTFNSAIPEAIERVVLRALEKVRDLRPATAGAFAHELNEVINGSTGSRSSYVGSTPSTRGPSEWNEETVEKQPDSARVNPLPDTVHMAMPGVRLDRHTGAAGPTITANVSKNVGRRYRSVAALVAIVVAGIITLLLLYQWDKTTRNENSVLTPTPNPTSTLSANGPTPKVPADSRPITTGMVQIGGGQFRMGSNEGDTDAQPSHMVAVKSFYLDIYEVTCRDYKKFLDQTKRQPPPTWKNGNYQPGSEQHPVTGVTWEDAVAYATWTRKRLPTEEEWEFAARGQEGLRYPWGNEWKPGCANADNVREAVIDVGSFNCNSPFGVQDLIGNAWEWTSSTWASYPGGKLAMAAHPSDKVIRGGSFQSTGDFISSTSRSGFKGLGIMTGFRCAMDIPDSTQQ